MQYIHIKKLEKYHPGYRDRDLKWAKILFNMVQGDPDCEMITNEIDWARLVKFIILELQAKRPIPNDEDYLKRKGFDTKKRPIELTLKVLHNFISIVENPYESAPNPLPREEKEERRERIEEEEIGYPAFENFVLKNWNEFCKKNPTISALVKISGSRRDKLKKRFTEAGFLEFDLILAAIQEQPFLLNGNPESKEHSDWRVNFDWLIANDTNYVKVLERAYKKGKPKLIDNTLEKMKEWEKEKQGV